MLENSKSDIKMIAEMLLKIESMLEACAEIKLELPISSSH
jgi:hypothetical protein